MKTNWKCFLSWLMVACMLIGTIPMDVYATEASVVTPGDAVNGGLNDSAELDSMVLQVSEGAEESNVNLTVTLDESCGLLTIYGDKYVLVKDGKEETDTYAGALTVTGVSNSYISLQDGANVALNNLTVANDDSSQQYGCINVVENAKVSVSIINTVSLSATGWFNGVKCYNNSACTVTGSGTLSLSATQYPVINCNGNNAVLDMSGFSGTLNIKPSGSYKAIIGKTLSIGANATVSVDASGSTCTRADELIDIDSYTGPDITVTFTDGKTAVYEGTISADSSAVTGLTGEGTEASPYLINNLDELKWFRDAVDGGASYASKYVQLAADIDLSEEISWNAIGNAERSGSGIGSGTAFAGVFDGNNKTITGLTSTSDDTTVGLFSALNGATVKDLNFASVSINCTSGKNVGALAGFAVNNSTVENVHVYGGSINAADGVGGVLGRMMISGSITGCSNAAAITANTAGGGIVGKAYYTATDGEMNITNCSNNGAVTTGYAAGGIVGLSAANVSGCSNSGAITAGTEAGGIVGEQVNYGEISGNTNAGVVSNGEAAGTSYGGIIGWIRYQTSTSDYAKSEVVVVKDNVNSGKIEADGASLGAGGIVGTVYNQATVCGNENTAETITGGTFAAGIVGGIQHADNNIALEGATTSVYNNVSNTSNITGNCVDAYAYNNDANTFVVEENGSAWVAIVSEAIALTSNVAEVNGTKYATLQAAIDAADGAMVTLISDVALTAPITVDSSKTLILDLAGCTVSYTDSSSKSIALLNNYGNLTITDSSEGGTGLVTFNSTTPSNTFLYATNTITNCGNLTITGGTFENVTTGTGASYIIDNNSTSNNVSLTISGGKLETAGVGGDAIRVFANSEINENSVTITGGSVGSIWMQNPSDGGGARNSKACVSSLTITGGSTGALYLEPSTNLSAAISGGTISSIGTFDTANSTETTVPSGFITGGTMKESVDETYLAEGYDLVENEDGTYTTVKVPMGTVTYGYTSAGGKIWGEATANATTSFMLELYSGETKIATTTLVEKTPILDGDVYVTWNFYMNEEDETADGYWDTVWEEGHPVYPVQPDKVVLYVDGVKVAENDVQMNAADSLYPVEWWQVEGVEGAPVVTTFAGGTTEKYGTLADALGEVSEGATIQMSAGTFEEGTVKLPAILKNVTIKGAENQTTVLKDMVLQSADGNELVYEGLTIDGIVFNNSNILLTGWRSGIESYKDWTITNCVFKDVVRDSANLAAVHVNVEETSAINGFTFTNNVIDGVSGGSNSGVYLAATGKITFTGNEVNNVAFRPILLQVADCDGVVDVIVVSDNTFSGSAKGRLQIYGTEQDNGDGTYTAIGTDNLSITITENIFKGITETYQICTWGINPNEGTVQVNYNYYDTDIVDKKIFWNNEKPETEAALAELGIYPIYTELNEDGTIAKESQYTPVIISGTGTVEDPYLINDLEDLKKFRDNVNAGNTYEGKYIKLTNSIDLSGEDWTPIGTSTNHFKGNFDGGENVISNLTINGNVNYYDNGTNYVGLFGYVKNGGYIKNVTIENVNITGCLYVGALVGRVYIGGVIENCHVRGNIAIEGYWYVGGIAGRYEYATGIYDCTVDGATLARTGSFIEADADAATNKDEDGSYVGGIVGFVAEGAYDIENCTVSNIMISGVTRVGGISGIGHYGNTISGCVVNNVTLKAAEGTTTVGLIVGATQGTASQPTEFENNTATDTNAYAGTTQITDVYGTNINGSTATTNYVAKIGSVYYEALADALTAAKDGETIELISGDQVISAAGAVFGNKTVTITGEAKFDWSKGWLFVGRGGEGDGKLIFDNATITSTEASLKNGTYGIHVSAPVKDSTTKNNGTVVFKDSAIELSYLANRGTVEVDGGKLNVVYGFWVGGRPATETPDGVAGTATMDIKNDAVVTVVNHNGMGIGHESKGIVNVEGATFEYTGASLTVTENSEFNVSGTSTVNITKLIDNNGDEGYINLSDGAVIKDSTVGGTLFANGDASFQGKNVVSTFNPGWYNHTITIGEDASLHVNGTNRMTIGWGNVFNITGSVEDAKTYDKSNATPSLQVDAGVSITGSGATFNVKDAYVVLGAATSKNSGANGTFDFNVKNSILDFTNVLKFVDSTNGCEPVFDLELKDSVMNVTSNLVFANAGCKVVVDDSVINAKASFKNGGELTLQNNSELNVESEIQLGENGGNTGSITVDDSKLNITCSSVGHALNGNGTGSLTLQNGAEAKITYITKTAVSVDETSKLVGDIAVYSSLESSGDISGTITKAADDAVIEISGGVYTQDVNEWCVEGYVALPDLNDQYVVGEEPTATINNLGAMTIPTGDYMIYGSGDDSVDMPLNFVMQFLADQTEEDMETSPFADWYGDFVITITGIENGSFTADGCYLAGYYGDFGWIQVPINGMTIEEGVRYPVMLGVGFGQKYDYICTGVKDFRCAMYLTEDILTANPNLEVKLELSLVDNSLGENAAVEAITEGKTIYEVSSLSYDVDNFLGWVASVTDSEGNVEKYKTLEEALEAAQVGDTVTLLGDTTITEKIEIADSLTIDGDGHVITVKGTRGIDVVKGNKGIDVVLKDLEIKNAEGNYLERGVNFNAAKSKLTLNNVKISGSTYALNVPGAATGSTVIINGSKLSGNIALNVWAQSMNIVANNTEFVSVDNTEVEDYTAVKLNNDGTTSAEGTEIEINGGSIKALDEAGNPSTATSNATETGTITVSDETIVVGNQKEVVAIISYGANQYSFFTLQGAVDHAANGETIIVIRDSEGAGAVINKSVTIDFNGKTYTLTEGVGSTGTESNGLQLLQGNDIVLKNGTLSVAEESKDKFYILVQNYSNLTVEDMTLDGTNLDKWSTTDGDSYVLSNNSGNVLLAGATNITANDEGDKAFAFDVCKNGNYEVPVVTVKTTGKISGNIEVSEGLDDNLTIHSGYYTMDVSEWCEDGFTASKNSQGLYTIVESRVASVNGKTYTTLDAAVEAATAGDTVRVLEDVVLKDTLVIPADKQITLELNGHVVSMHCSDDSKDSTGKFINHEMIKNLGNLTIVDSVGNGTLKYIYTGADSNFAIATNTITSEPGSALTVNSGSIINETTANGIAYAIDGRTNGNNGDVTITINGGYVSSEKIAIRVFANSTVNTDTLKITDGIVRGRITMQSANINANKGVLEITGGDFYINDSQYWMVTLTAPSGSDTSAMQSSISGGTFRGVISTAFGKFISGGNFIEYKFAYGEETYSSIEDYLKYYLVDHCEIKYVETNEDGEDVYTAEMQYVASVEDTFYGSLTEAIAAAEDAGDRTVTLLTNVTENVTITTDMTLDLNGMKLSGTIELTDGELIVRNGDIVSENDAFRVMGGRVEICSDVNVTAGECAVYIRGGEVVTAGNLTSTGIYATIQGNGNYSGDVTITGGTVSNASNVAIFWPQNGNLVVAEDSVVTGTTGIYIKQGTLKVQNAKVVATGDAVPHVVLADGCESTGDAITVDVYQAEGFVNPVVTLDNADLTAVYGSLVGIYGGQVTLENGDLNANVDAFHIEGGTLNINNGNVTAKDCVVYTKGGVVNITGGNLKSTGDYATIQGNGSADAGDVNITGGEISHAENIAIYWPQNANLTISDGTISGTAALYAKSGNITITGGEFYADGAKVDYVYNGNGANETGDAVIIDVCGGGYETPEVTISGGKFVSENAAAVASYASATAEDEAVTEFISGGEFSSDVSALCVDTLEAKDSNSDGIWTIVTKTDAVAQIGDVEYDTLSEALSAAKSGDTVTLLNPCSVTQVMIPTGITLDLNGQELTAMFLASFGNIVDGINGGIGKIVIAQNSLMISDYTQLPLYDTTEGCYRFFKYDVKSLGVLNDKNNNPKFYFDFEFDNTLAIQILQRSASTGLSFRTQLDWTGAPNENYITFDNSKLIEWATGENSGGDKVFVLTVSGTDTLNTGDVVTVTPIFDVNNITKKFNELPYTIM